MQKSNLMDLQFAILAKKCHRVNTKTYFAMNIKTLTVIPPLLKQIPQPPRQLYVLGKDLGDMLSRPRLAVVGSRKITNYGRQVTEQLVSELARQGVVIISGLAYGVDAAAHRAALQAGGITIAVLPSPINNIAPTGHTGLAREILAKGGTLISEYAPGTVAYKGNFVERNRLVSGLADAVLITEAAARSGSLHTAGFAIDQGKEVLAVPGNINSPMSEGTNQLIKTGATPVTSTQDVLLALGLDNPARQTQQVLAGLSKAEQVIITLIKQGTHGGNELAQSSELDVSVFNQTLTMLEINGLIKSLGGNSWSIN